MGAGDLRVLPPFCEVRSSENEDEANNVGDDGYGCNLSEEKPKGRVGEEERFACTHGFQPEEKCDWDASHDEVGEELEPVRLCQSEVEEGDGLAQFIIEKGVACVCEGIWGCVGAGALRGE